MDAAGVAVADRPRLDGDLQLEIVVLVQLVGHLSLHHPLYPTVSLAPSRCSSPAL